MTQNNISPSEPGPNPEFEALVRYVESLREEVVGLVLERDILLFHQQPALESRYWTTLGIVESQTFEFEVSVLRIRSKLSFLQAAVNRDEKADLNAVEAALDDELKAYNQRLKDESKKIDDAFYFQNNAKPLSDADEKKLKKYYYQLVKALHPDVAPQTTPQRQAKLKQAIDAYKRGDVATLQALVYTLETLDSNGGKSPTNSPQLPDKSAFERLYEERDSLQKTRNALLASTEKIKTSFPFDVADFLADADAVRMRLDELKAKQAELRDIYRQYEEKIEEILRRWEN